MKSLSQSEYGELRSLYQQVYTSTDEITVDDLSEEVVEEIFNELVQEYVSEGYEIEEVLDIVEDAALDFIEAKVTYGHDTEAPAAPEKKSMLQGRIRYARRKAGEAVKRAGEKAQGAVAGVQIAGSIARDEARRAGRAAQHSVTKAADAVKRAPGEAKRRAKSGIKGFIRRQAEKVVSRMSEEAIFEVEMSEGYKEIDREKHDRMYDRYKKLRTAAMKDAQETGEASGSNRMKMGRMQGVISKSAENLRKKVEEELELDQMIESLIERGHTEQEAYALVAQFTLDEGIIDAAKAGSKRHEDAMKGAGRAIKKARIRTRKLGRALAPAADTAMSAASGVGRAAKATYEAGKKTGEFVKKGAQRHNDMVKAAKKVFSKEELELIAQIMIDEGYNLSDYTWEEFHTLCLDAEMLDENRAAARSAGGYKDDSKKQSDPSKEGFTGVGNMSIKDIMALNKKIEARNKKK